MVDGCRVDSETLCELWEHGRHCTPINKNSLVRGLIGDLIDARSEAAELWRENEDLRERNRRLRREKVLVVKFMDCCQIYARKNTDVKVLDIPCVSSIDPVIPKIEEIITAKLPRDFQEVYWPSFLTEEIELT